MTSREFLNEVLNSDICPDNFEEIYKDFQHFQQAAMDTLNEFHRVCEKNGIHYQLAYGSLLGAIRDNGQIPWDYDIDVFVPYEEKDNLIEALKKDLNEKFYFYCPEINKKCRHFFMRLAPKGYRTEALHVDVFYLIGLPDDENMQQQFFEERNRLVNIRYIKLVNAIEESQKKIRTFLVMLQKKVKCTGESVVSCTESFERLASQYKCYDVKYCMSTFTDSRKFMSSMIYNTTLLTTTSGEFRIPVEYDDILQTIYGDYKRVPSLENRINELCRSYNRLVYFEKLGCRNK